MVFSQLCEGFAKPVERDVPPFWFLLWQPNIFLSCLVYEYTTWGLFGPGLSQRYVLIITGMWERTEVSGNLEIYFRNVRDGVPYGACGQLPFVPLGRLPSFSNIGVRSGFAISLPPRAASLVFFPPSSTCPARANIAEWIRSMATLGRDGETKQEQTRISMRWQMMWDLSSKTIRVVWLCNRPVTLMKHICHAR